MGRGRYTYQPGNSEGVIDIEEADGVLEGAVLERRVGGSHCQKSIKLEKIGWSSPARIDVSVCSGTKRAVKKQNENEEN